MNVDQPRGHRVAVIASLLVAIALAVPVMQGVNGYTQHEQRIRAGGPAPVLLPAPVHERRPAHADTAAPTPLPAAHPVPVTPLQPRSRSGPALRINVSHRSGAASRRSASALSRPAGRVLPSANHPRNVSDREAAALLSVLCALLGLYGLIRRRRFARPSRFLIRCSLALALPFSLSACGASTTSHSTQSPSAYLNGALAWIQAHSALSQRVDWPALRRGAKSKVHDPHRTADTYPAIVFALEQLGDGNGFLLRPEQVAHPADPGMFAISPKNLVVYVDPKGRAARAGVRVGDRIDMVNGALPRRFEGMKDIDLGSGRVRLLLRRPGRTAPVRASFAVQHADASEPCTGTPQGKVLRTDRAVVGYLSLPVDCGSAQYVTEAQRLLRSADSRGACGWMIDLRQNHGGDIWTYLAALGPILKDGKVGGFVYPDGRRESWVYRNGEVLLNGRKRDESDTGSPAYRERHPLAPVAILTGPATNAAGELAAVALRGQANTRSFGQPTEGYPTLTLSTPLSDGALLLISGAFAADRTGRQYTGPLIPQTRSATDWTHFATGKDPTIRAALRWLQRRSECTGA